MAGLPAAIIKKYGVTKKAWAVFRGRHPNKARKVKTNKGSDRVVRRRYSKKVHHRSNTTVPIAVVGGFLAGLIEPAQLIQQGQFQAAGESVVRSYTGYDIASGSFNAQYLWKGFAPLFLGFIVHGLASKLGVNRALGRAGIPFLRV